jgi:hypothetical protein|tara:strand:+ start:1848 stop:2507 length:660 start_codon:yes stop_codon:yes gene_type:complete
MKDFKKTILALIVLVIVLCLHPSCTKQTIYATACNGNCDTEFEVVYQGLPLQSINGYYEIKWDGLNYFQIKGQLSELNDEYVINGVPLVEVKYDSDYWILTDSIQFQTPMYSYLGWFNDATFNTPITFDNYTYTIGNILNQHSPLNVVGYQYPKNLCVDCPYTESLLGSYSKYNYKPTQNILLDNEMIGDTINIFIETEFNTDIGESETVTNQIKVIVI